MEFECVRCGHCCTHLKGVNMGQVHGLTLLPGEIGLFQGELVKPIMRYSLEDQLSPGGIFLYQLDVDVCPHYDEDVGCRIYSDRPLTCAAYPLEITFRHAILHTRCPEVKRMRAKEGSHIRVPQNYVAAAGKVHKYYVDHLRTTDMERFDLKEGRWRGMIEGLSKADIKFLRQ